MLKLRYFKNESLREAIAEIGDINGISRILIDWDRNEAVIEVEQ